MLRTLSRTRSHPLPKRNSHRQTFILVTAINSPAYRQPKQSASKFRIPTEILDKIVEFAILIPAPASNVDPFPYIASFSLASHAFRQIALRRYLHHVVIRSRMHWDWLFRVISGQDSRTKGKGGSIDIQIFISKSSFLAFDLARLSTLTHLRELSMNLETEGLHTQHVFVTTMFKHLLTSTSNCSSSLVKLVLTSIPRIDISLLALIAKSLPLLSILHITATDQVDDYDWINGELCWCCIDDVLDCSFHSAIPEMFATPEAMATECATALLPLTNLRSLLLGVYLSDEGLRWKHILNCVQASAPPHLALEDCVSCYETYGLAVRHREEVASNIIASRLPSLEIISWHSYFNEVPSEGEVGLRRARKDEYVRRVNFEVSKDRKATRMVTT